MEKQKFKKAFGQKFLLIEGAFSPVHTTWAQLAKEIKNPSGDLSAHRGKEIALEKHGAVMSPVRVIGFQYPNGDETKPPQFAFVYIGKGKQAIKL